MHACGGRPGRGQRRGWLSRKTCVSPEQVSCLLLLPLCLSPIRQSPVVHPCRARQLAQKTADMRGPENIAADLIKRREEQQRAQTAARLAGGAAADEGARRGREPTDWVLWMFCWAGHGRWGWA